MQTTPTLTIRPETKSSLTAELHELWRFRFLIGSLIRRDLRVRYRGSAVGLIWSLISPLLQILVMTIAVGFFMGSGPHNLSVFLLCAFAPWTYFQTSILDASAIVLTYQSLIKKVYFPREIPVITACCTNFIQLLVSLGIFALYRWGIAALIHGWPGPPPIELLWLPVILLMTFLLTLATALFVTGACYFHDEFRFLLQLWVTVLFYFVPILYFAENIFYTARIHTGWLRILIYRLYLCNPLAWLVSAYKQIFFGRTVISPEHQAMQYSASFDDRFLVLHLVSIGVLLVSGYTYYNRRKWSFTERP